MTRARPAKSIGASSDKADRRAVGETSADAHVAHGRQFGVGVLGAARVVRPVVQRGDAGGERLGGAETNGAIAVLGTHQRAEARGHREVAERGNVGADVKAEQGVPQVEMGIDEAGNADHARAVDDLRGGRLDLLGDRDDGPVADMHVAGCEVGHGGIHGEHGGAADERIRRVPATARPARGGARGLLRQKLLRYERCRS